MFFYPSLRVLGKSIMIGTMNRGIQAITVRTGRMVYVSASFPIIGAIAPQRPKANPIIRLATIERTLGAKVWAIVTPRGRGARTKLPASAAPR